MIGEDFEKYLIKEYLEEDNKLSMICDDLKNWGRRLPPILGGTIAATITSNPTFLGVGAIILVLEELGIDIKELIKSKKDRKTIEVHKSKECLNEFDKTKILDQVIYELEMTLMLYGVDLVITYDELKVIMNNIMKLVEKDGYSESTYDILNYYYKRSIANVINSDSSEVDYYDMMNGLNYLLDLNIFNKDEILMMVKNIVNELNKQYKRDKATIINYDFQNKKRLV